ncbi:hypothetical protein GOBAR_DD06830 [Gossypium barbadense]|nr:hypothetical protein GOBAR_DD06830 [Gossypium barbadense]
MPPVDKIFSMHKSNAATKACASRISDQRPQQCWPPTHTKAESPNRSHPYCQFPLSRLHIDLDHIGKPVNSI